ncbi:MAG: cysteine--tRNA ligase [bacterium]|nr:cysteine--tRNA ligase [bacterium]
MITLYNTLSRKKEVVQPKPEKKLNLFVCGITPYDYAHIGHARTYIVFDAFVRYLTTLGNRVFYLQNVTDIEDKIIKRAKEKNMSPRSLAKMFEKEYLKDMKALGITSVNQYARATEYIPEIISQIQRLEKKGYAYELAGDGVYYDILKFKEYGKLSRRTSQKAEDAISRIDDSVKKRNKGDFALWKISKEGEPKWKSPWGWGRPGWHIEDTAITEKYFGAQYDLHGGARDLIFPHHEAEIAQMEAISGKKPMARHWMHSGFLTVEGVKMSKSLGNFVTIKDFLKEHSVRVLRLLVLKAHYRSPIDYSPLLLVQTKRELERLDEFVDRLCEKSQTTNYKTQTKHKFKIQNSKLAFAKALADDFNTPKAIAVLFEVLTKGNTQMAKDALSLQDVKEILIFLKEVDGVFGFLSFKRKGNAIPTGVMKLAKEREEYRQSSQWEKADEMRKTLMEMGYEVEDTPEGPKLKKTS